MGYKINDFLICCPKDDSLRDAKNKDFELYARIIDIDENEGTITLDKYLKEGKLHNLYKGHPHVNTFEDVDEYYRPMRYDELTSFRTNLYMHKDDNELTRQTYEAAKVAVVRENINIYKGLMDKRYLSESEHQELCKIRWFLEKDIDTLLSLFPDGKAEKEQEISETRDEQDFER